MSKQWIPFMVGLTIVLTSLCAQAGIEVFTVAGKPVTHVPDKAEVTEIDQPARLDKQLSEDLPGQEDEAVQVVQKRLADFKTKYDTAYDGLLRAWDLGIEQVPAVVVDGQYVVYGEADVQTAIDEIDRHKEAS